LAELPSPCRIPGPCETCPVWPSVLYATDAPGARAEVMRLRKEYRLLRARGNIYRAGDVTEEIFTLYDGWAVRYTLLPDGQRQILSFLLPGDPISLPMLLFDRLPFSVQALTDVSLCVFDKVAMAAYLHARPACVRRLEAFLAREAAAAEGRVTDLGRRSAEERVARLVLQLFARLRRRNAVRDRSFAFPLRHRHIADALGLTAVHVGRVLNRLRGEGLLLLERGSLTILDQRTLLKTAGTRESDLDWEQPYLGSI